VEKYDLFKIHRDFFHRTALGNEPRIRRWRITVIAARREPRAYLRGDVVSLDEALTRPGRGESEATSQTRSVLSSHNSFREQKTVEVGGSNTPNPKIHRDFLRIGPRWVKFHSDFFGRAPRGSDFRYAKRNSRSEAFISDPFFFASRPDS
jgi:hypothetical protein